MTDQEAEVLAARLTRIWESEKVSYEHNRSEILAFLLHLGEDTWVKMWCYTADEQSLNITRLTDGAITGSLCLDRRGNVDDGSSWAGPGLEQRKQRAEFSLQWLTFFRRGCWLMGFDIEASAHEKAEWIQGFTHEELQAWNLKM